MRWLEHRIPPPLVALVCAAAMWGLAHAEVPLQLATALRLVGALTLSIPGLACSIAGFLTFRREGANIDPHRIDRGAVLVTGGVYRISRNPMYLGMALVLCAYAIDLARPLGVFGPVAFVAFITRFQIQPEERAMRAKFGETYLAYCAGTRRWL